MSKLMEEVTAPKIFKAYDIRGIYPGELDEGLAYLVGRAVATYLNPQTILVGRDMRVSSVPLRDALVRGLRDQGVNVVDIGFCSTPMFYWASQKYQAGIMVTASHNPAKYNGFKIVKNGAFPVGETSGMKDIEQLVYSQSFPSSDRQGTYEEKDVLQDFISFNLSFLKTSKPFTIVIDAGNGMGGYTYNALLSRLPPNIKVIPMFFEPDGTFPNHEANPVKEETTRQLQQRVRAEHADLGVALDGDEDRVCFIDDTGAYLASDYPTALLARQVLSERPGSKIIYSIIQSRICPEEITRAGGVPLICKVGHANFKIMMHETGAAFGGELSGHYYNCEQQNSENTQIVLFRLLNLLAAEGKSLSQLVAPLHRYSKIGETNFEVPDPRQVVARIDEQYAASAPQITRIDGFRADYDDWWFSVRPSNTEPLLRLNLEARTPSLLQEKFDELKAQIGGKIHF